MVKLFSLLLLIQGSVFAKDIKLCKQTIAKVSGFVSKTELAVDDFSTSKFEDFDLTVKEYNALSTEQQKKIFLKIRPLSAMIKKYSGDVSYFIEYLTENTEANTKNPGALDAFVAIQKNMKKYCYNKS